MMHQPWQDCITENYERDETHLQMPDGLTVPTLAIQRQQPCPFLASMVKKSSTLIKMIVLQCSRPGIGVMDASHSNAFDRGILGPVRDKITQASVRTARSLHTQQLEAGSEPVECMNERCGGGYDKG